MKLYCLDYDEIKAKLDDTVVPTTSMEVSQIKDIKYGDSGSIYDFFSFKYYPENNTELNVENGVTSSDENVIKVTEDLWCADNISAVGTGKCTLTFTSNLGRFTQSLEITIGEGDSEESSSDYSDWNIAVHRSGAYVNGYSGTDTNVVVPSTYQSYPVVGISSNAFKDNTRIKRVYIPDNVISIEQYAFSGCSSLKSITIPDSVTSIGNYAFYNCSSLKSVTIGNSVTSIPYSAFKNCSSLTSITIPDSVTSIGEYAFYNCSSLISVTIGNGVTSIDYRAFYGCSSLSAVYISDIAAWCNISFYRSDSNPVYYAKNLYINGELATDIVIPDSVTSIGDCAFYGCSSLKSVTIGNGVTGIGSSAFYNCSSLTSIIIPDSVTSIGEYAFQYCSSLKSITIPDSVTSIGNNAFVYYYYYKYYYPTIYGYAGSYAQTYAEDNNIPFIDLCIHKEDNTTEISVEYSNNVFDGDVIFNVEQLAVEMVELSTTYEKALVYDISFYVNEKQVQPNGNVTIKLPIPDGYNTKTLKIYHEKSDGTFENVNFTVVGGYAVFEASSFSIYVFVDESSEIPEDSSLTSCSCGCHKTGFFGFLWKIMMFFYELFGINQTCSCGAEHY